MKHYLFTGLDHGDTWGVIIIAPTEQNAIARLQEHLRELGKYGLQYSDVTQLRRLVNVTGCIYSTIKRKSKACRHQTGKPSTKPSKS